MVHQINENEFSNKVLKSTKKVVVDFYATWCGPCKMLASVMEELSENNPEIDFFKVNVDENPQLAQTYQISSIPNVLIFNNGEYINNSLGYKSIDQLQDFINKAR